MKKKMMASILAVTVAAAMMAGCGSSSSTSDTSEDTSTSEESSETEDTSKEESSEEDDSSSTVEMSEDAVEVEFWYAGGKTAVNVVQEMVDEFNASQSTYYVTTVTQADYSETYTNLQAAIAGNAAPDLVLLGTESGRSLSDKGLLADLSPMIEADDEFNEEDYLEVFYEQGVDDDGKVYGLPAYGTTQVLYYNIEAFEAAGVDPESIETWQDLGEAAQLIKDAGYDYGWEPMWGYDNLIDAAFSNGASIFNEDGTEVTINSEEWVEVWEAFRTWIHDDEIMTIHSGGQGWEYWYETIDDVLLNKAGGYTGSSGDQADLDFSIVAALEQPAWDEDSTSAPQVDAIILDVLSSSSEEEQQGAFEFIKYFMNVENQVKWTMETGYVPVNVNIDENEDYQAYVAENPQAAVPFEQAMHGTVYPYDPTSGEIEDALSIAADEVEIDGVSAQEALDAAQKTAQAALDEALGQ